MKPSLAIEPLSPAILPRMLAASAADGGHCAPLATHVFLREGEIIGAAALGAPVLNFWARTDLHRRESVELALRCVTRVREVYGEKFLATCAPTSPFFPLMPRFGFRRIGSADFFEHATV